MALDPAARAAAVVAAAVVNDNVVEIAAPEPESAVADAAPLPGETDVPSEDTVDEVIEATAEDAPKQKSAREQIREAGDLMRQFNDFIFLACACGMRFKLPPEYKHD
ncbi:MAG: hypothetical protein VW405_16965, partial [Rhodospirillaceae bacterium]